MAPQDLQGPGTPQEQECWEYVGEGGTFQAVRPPQGHLKPFPLEDTWLWIPFPFTGFQGFMCGLEEPLDPGLIEGDDSFHLNDQDSLGPSYSLALEMGFHDLSPTWQGRGW